MLAQVQKDQPLAEFLRAIARRKMQQRAVEGVALFVE
jgi:hypothetical protein